MPPGDESSLSTSMPISFDALGIMQISPLQSSQKETIPKAIGPNVGKIKKEWSYYAFHLCSKLKEQVEGF